MKSSKQFDFWHADFSNMILGHVVKDLSKCNICVNCCGFPPFPALFNFEFICRYGFSKISSFFQVVGLSAFGDDKFLRNS